MTRETFELMRNMDINAVETQMALRCAPLIMELKTSNLLIVPDSQVSGLRRLLCHTRMESFLLDMNQKQKAVFLLYRVEALSDYLKDQAVRKLLRQLGYVDFSFESLLDGFAVRYAAYMRGKAAFPHEMGIFLGYPVEDVRGFMENKGKNSLYTGYWKVYGNEVQKARMFHYFDLAAELLVRLLAHGVPMEEVLACA